MQRSRSVISFEQRKFTDLKAISSARTCRGFVILGHFSETEKCPRPSSSTSSPSSRYDTSTSAKACNSPFTSPGLKEVHSDISRVTRSIRMVLPGMIRAWRISLSFSPLCGGFLKSPYCAVIILVCFNCKVTTFKSKHPYLLYFWPRSKTFTTLVKNV